MPISEKIVYDDFDPCPYIEGQTSCMPLRWQFQTLTAEEFDSSLAGGDRRVGKMLYRTNCPQCNACEPIRVPVQEFKRSKSQRKKWKKGNRIHVEEGPAIFSHQKLKMYNRHKHERSLAKNERIMTQDGYESWFIRTCTRTRELRYFYEKQLVGISILDVGKKDISSVYFYFDPDFSHLSLGTYSVLFEIQWMRLRMMRYYYLGLYVDSCVHLNYKSQYFPHERLIDGMWHPFTKK